MVRAVAGCASLSIVEAHGNRIEIFVANLWINRLIRDASLPPEQRLTSAEGYWRFGKDEALRASGLLGPVVLKTSKQEGNA